MDREDLRSALRELDRPHVEVDRARRAVTNRVRRHRRRSVAAGVAAVGLLAAGAGIALSGGPAPKRGDAAAVVTANAELVVVAPYDGQVQLVDPATGAVRTVEVEISVGDPPAKLAPIGDDHFVYYGPNGIRRIDDELYGPWLPLGEALFFVESTEPGQVWLIDRVSDPSEPERFSARAVDVDGRIVVPGRELQPGMFPYRGGGPGTLVVSDRHGLGLFDVRSGAFRRLSRTGGGLVAANEHGVAWFEECPVGCRGLRFLAYDRSEPEAVTTGEGVEYDADGAISPDGRTVALIARVGAERHLVLAERGEAPVDTGAALSDIPELAWSPEGNVVFYLGPELDRLRSYDVQARSRTSLDVRGIKARGLFATYAPRRTRPSPSGFDALGCARGRGAQHVEVNWQGREVRGMQLECAQLQRANLSRAKLIDSNLAGAVLIGASFRGATLSYTSLQYARGPLADFTGATFDRANLLGAEFSNARFDGTRWHSTTCPDGTNSDAHGDTCIGHLG
ncbi:MAG TPA: pentapeptide repeat-containing protein [Mycobacteriales bacterium]|nr:pentapeptide repeat-containing protein [Mycobacteriales bacterium]